MPMYYTRRLYARLVTRTSPPPVSAGFMARKAEVLEERLVPPRSSRAYTRLVYRTPVRMSSVTAFGSRYISPARQLGLSNAVDFYVPEGTPVRSPADGVVDEISERSGSGGVSARYWLRGNGVGIRCAGGERVWLEHLQRGFASRLRLKVGQAVSACDAVGISGNTGFTENPHVHAEVQRSLGPGARASGYVTLRIRFDRRDIPFDIYRAGSR